MRCNLSSQFRPPSEAQSLDHLDKRQTSKFPTSNVLRQDLKPTYVDTENLQRRNPDPTVSHPFIHQPPSHRRWEEFKAPFPHRYQTSCMNDSYHTFHHAQRCIPYFPTLPSNRDRQRISQHKKLSSIGNSSSSSSAQPADEHFPSVPGRFPPSTALHLSSKP